MPFPRQATVLQATDRTRDCNELMTDTCIPLRLRLLPGMGTRPLLQHDTFRLHLRGGYHPAVLEGLCSAIQTPAPSARHDPPRGGSGGVNLKHASSNTATAAAAAQQQHAASEHEAGPPPTPPEAGRRAAETRAWRCPKDVA
jgi:hypothetical protein